jgi:hypothetical protein
VIVTGKIRGPAASRPGPPIATPAACSSSATGLHGSWKCRQLRSVASIFRQVIQQVNWSGTVLHYFCRYGLAGLTIPTPNAPR